MESSGHDERGDRWERRLEIPMLVAAVLVLPLLVLEQTASSAGARQFASALNWAVWTAFALEMVIMLAVVNDRWRWIRSHPLEVIVVALTGPFLPSSMQAFRALRLLRLLRLVLLARRAQALLTPGGLSHAAVLSFLAVLGGGAALRETEPQLELSFADSIWWALTTATTVGYGDIYPRTDTGRIIAALVMLIGIGFVALLTAAMARKYAGAGREAHDLDVLVRELRERLPRSQVLVPGSEPAREAGCVCPGVDAADTPDDLVTWTVHRRCEVHGGSAAGG